MPSLSHYLILGATLFAIGVVGIFLNRKNLIVLMMAIELMLLAVNMNFVAFSHYLGDASGQLFVFFILTVAAADPPSAWRFWWRCSAISPRFMSMTSTASRDRPDRWTCIRST